MFYAHGDRDISASFFNKRKFLQALFCAAFFIFLVAIDARLAHSWQEGAIVAGPNGQQIKMIKGPNGEMSAVDANTGQPIEGGPGGTGGPKKGGPGGDDDKNKKPDGKGKDGDSGEIKIIKHSDRPKPKADKSEIENAKADKDGRYHFMFSGQTWPDVLDWLATISNKSLNWQKLPGDYLYMNVNKQGPTLDELMDILNRNLFIQGFTMFDLNGTLTVVELKGLNPAIVPRVKVEDLAKLPSFSFVKVTIPMENLIAEEAVKELKPLLSTYSQLNALKSSNQIEVLDTVITLRELMNYVGKKQVREVREQSLKEFSLRFAVASEVREQLMTLLGIEDKARKPVSGGGGSRGGGGGQMEMMMQQQVQQMQEQMQRQGGGGGGPGKAAKPEIYFVINERRNTVYAHAPVDTMAKIEQMVKMLDVPSDVADGFLANSNKMQPYTLSGTDPDTLIKSITDLCVLEPQTKLYVTDKKNRTFVAYASMQDHMTIRALIKKLDVMGRKPEVIYLRRLAADVVAVSIDFLMNGEKEKKNNRSSYSYDYYSPWGSSNRGDDNNSTEKFRVVPDIEHNRILMYCNPDEKEKVENLLVKLGEVPDRASSTGNHRTVNLPDGISREEFIQKLKEVWPQVSPTNPLHVPELPPVVPQSDQDSTPAAPSSLKPDEKAKPVTDKNTSETRRVEPKKESTTETNRTASNNTLEKGVNPVKARTPGTYANWQNTSVEQKATESPSKEPTSTAVPKESADNKDATNIGTPNKAPANQNGVKSDDPNLKDVSPELLGTAPSTSTSAGSPVKVSWGLDGQLMISSDDPEALNKLEDLLWKINPQSPDYFVIQLSPNADAWIVSGKLEKYFKEEEKNENNSRGRYFFYDSYGSDSSKDDPLGKITKRRPLKFIDDDKTNTIIVVGATARQKVIIEDLIKIYDKQVPLNTQAGRRTMPYTLKYSKAKVVADAVKDVYRELLSTKDRALQNNNDKKQLPSGQTYIFNEGGGGETNEGKRTQVTFNGRLSIGVDELSNTLLISTDGLNLMQNVMQLVEALDESAKPVQTAIKAMRLGPSLGSPDSRKSLMKALQEKPAPRNPPQNQQQNPNQQNNQQNQNQNGNEGSNGQGGEAVSGQ